MPLNTINIITKSEMKPSNPWWLKKCTYELWACHCPHASCIAVESKPFPYAMRLLPARRLLLILHFQICNRRASDSIPFARSGAITMFQIPTNGTARNKQTAANFAGSFSFLMDGHPSLISQDKNKPANGVTAAKRELLSRHNEYVVTIEAHDIKRVA